MKQNSSVYKKIRYNRAITKYGLGFNKKNNFNRYKVQRERTPIHIEDNDHEYNQNIPLVEFEHALKISKDNSVHVTMMYVFQVAVLRLRIFMYRVSM